MSLAGAALVLLLQPALVILGPQELLHRRRRPLRVGELGPPFLQLAAELPRVVQRERRVVRSLRHVMPQDWYQQGRSLLVTVNTGMDCQTWRTAV